LLFDPRPKDSREDLYDREREVDALVESGLPLILLLGRRRIGKSSVLRVALREVGGVYLDARLLYAESGGWIPTRLFIEALADALGEARGRLRRGLERAVRHVEGVTVAGIRLNLSREPALRELLGALEAAGATIGVDEAQYLRYSGARGGRELLALFAYIYDNLQGVRLILSGSEVGLLHDFLGLDDYRSPLYGRPYRAVTLAPFTRRQSLEFLERGFAERGLQPPRETLEAAVAELDGVPGWLVDFGLAYLSHGSLDEALREVYSRAEGFVKGELALLERRSPRYAELLKAVAAGYTSWESLRRYMGARGVRSTSTLSRLLRGLEKMGWVEKRLVDGRPRYRVSDPVVERVLRRL